MRIQHQLHPRLSCLLACLAIGLLAPVAAVAADEIFSADMSSSGEVPPTKSAGHGTVKASLDLQTRELSYTVSWSGLTGPAIMAHFHGPAPAGANAGVTLPLGNDPTDPITGRATLTEDQVQALESGQWYANIHTAKNKGGEIRGQMVKGG